METFIKEGFTVLPSVCYSVENSIHFWTHALEAQYLSKRYNWPGKLGGLICTNWRPLNHEYVENMLTCMNGGEAGDAMDAKVGKVIRAMEPKIEKFDL
ncbi:MAG: hypothetical protein IKT57_00330 [Clostridia bacterium]|nr:hypothetical protein [Clostridia bacterium]